MLEGQALVEKLRSDELRSILNDVGTDLRDQILKALDERGSAQELIRQQYTGRYPFELLQNANDAAVDSAAGRKVMFAVTGTALLVADQGSGFGAAQIGAICRLGRSSKDPRKSIGYKGLGFKSVGEITDRPQIISGNVGFGFDAARTREAVQELTGPLDPGQRLPVYAFPFPLRSDDLADDGDVVDGLARRGFTTVLRLPFRVGVARDTVQTHLRETINPRLLLFLDATESLELQGTDADFDATVVRSGTGDVAEVLLQAAQDRVEHWLVFRRLLADLDRKLIDPLGEPWRLVEQVHVAAAVPLLEGGKPGRTTAEPLHVYFPTEETTGLPMILHGDFALELDRRHVGRSPEMMPYNSWLATRLGDLVGDVAEQLASRYPNEASVVGCLAPVATATGFGVDLLERCMTRLRGSKFIPVITGSALVASNAAVLPQSVPTIDSAHRFLQVGRVPGLVIPGVEADGPSRQLLTELLGTPAIGTAAALALLREPPQDEDVDFYEFLVAWREAEGWQFPKLLSSVKCVRIFGGGWSAPGAKVFFARQREEVEFPEALQVPIADVPEHIEGVRPLLEAAGVRPFEWRQLIPEFVLPLLTSPAAADATRNAALLALRKYFETERTGDPRIRSQIAQVLMPAKTADGARRTMRPARDVYFSSSWVGHDRLERIYGPFGEAEFLDIDTPLDDAQRQRDIEFYEWIGIARRPRTDEVREPHSLGFLGRHPHTSYGPLWDHWQHSTLKDVEVCAQGHTTSQQLRSSFALDRLPALVAAKHGERLRLLWKELALGWSHYQVAMTSDIHCDHGWHADRGDKTRAVPSFMSYMLTELPWVAAVRRRAPILTTPGRAWRVTLETPRQIVERVPVLDRRLDGRESASMVAALGIIDAGRPAAEDLVALLRQLAEDFDGTPEEERRGMQLAARWAMRTLNDIVGDSEPQPPVPLLARYDGKPVFTERPLVATDPFLKETWEPLFPILDADHDLRALHRALQLRSLDREVRVHADPRRVRPDRQVLIEAWLREAKPYLAAIAIEQAPSREEEVMRGLARLEIIVCDELMLRYEFDGQVQERDEAVAYMAERIVQEGSARRRFGTAHLELDPKTGWPHWYAFGPQLAAFVGTPNQADAFALVLAADKAARRHYLTARRISSASVELARIHLAEAPADYLIDDLVDFDESSSTDEEELPEPGVSESVVGAHARSGIEASDAPPVEESELPPLEVQSITVRDAPRVEPIPNASSDTASRRRPGLGPAGPIDHQRQQAVQRRIGLRGEEAAYRAEVNRVLGRGQDPTVVVWRAKSHELAPYDMESLDEHGQRIFIEVKATTSADPYDPFEISEAELLFAIDKRGRYSIYRVTEAHTATPSVTRFDDPIGRLRENTATLRLSGARMRFAPG